MLAAVKVADAVQWGRWYAAAWLVTCLLAPFARAGWAVLAGLALAGWLSPTERLDSNHLILVMWVAAILAAAPVGEVRNYLLRVQAVVLYAFAVVNKAFSPAFLIGAVIAGRTTAIPVIPAAFAAIAIEWWLAWAVWRRSRWALPVAVVFHVGVTAFMGRDLYEWALLGSFNAIVVLMVWRATR